MLLSLFHCMQNWTTFKYTENVASFFTSAHSMGENLNNSQAKRWYPQYSNCQQNIFFFKFSGFEYIRQCLALLFCINKWWKNAKYRHSNSQLLLFNKQISPSQEIFTIFSTLHRMFYSLQKKKYGIFPRKTVEGERMVNGNVGEWALS